MKITIEDRNNALTALDNAYCVADRVFQCCPDRDTFIAWEVMRSIEDLQHYIEQAEIVNEYT